MSFETGYNAADKYLKGLDDNVTDEQLNQYYADLIPTEHIDPAVGTPEKPIDNNRYTTIPTEHIDTIASAPEKHIPIVTTSAKPSSSNNRNIRNNNIGNIKDFGIKWNGMVGSESGGHVASGSFVQFVSPEYGVRALALDLNSKRKRNLNTIEKILPVYAPNGRENNTEAYIASVVSSTGIARDKILTDKDMFNIIKAIGKHEGDNKNYFTDDIIQRGLNMALHKKK